MFRVERTPFVIPKESVHAKSAVALSVHFRLADGFLRNDKRSGQKTVAFRTKDKR